MSGHGFSFQRSGVEVGVRAESRVTCRGGGGKDWAVSVGMGVGGAAEEVGGVNEGGA